MEIAPELPQLAESFDLTPRMMRTLLMPRQVSDGASKIAAGLKFGGLAGLLGIIPLVSISMGTALAAIGIGQIVSMVGQRISDNAQRQALTDSVTEALADLERNMKREVAKSYQQLETQMKQAIDQYCEAVLAEVRKPLEDITMRRSELEVKRNKLAELNESILPQLRTSLTVLFK